jgi:hypothetical protein
VIAESDYSNPYRDPVLVIKLTHTGPHYMTARSVAFCYVTVLLVYCNGGGSYD